MNINRSYLDYNASAPLRPVAKEVMLEVLLACGNASSVHGEGRNQRRVIEHARAEVADFIGGNVEGVIFTASATEAAFLALTPYIYNNGTLRRATKLYVLAVEHPCILAGGRFAPRDISILPVLPNGLIDLQAFEAVLDRDMQEHKGTEPFVPYVAVQLVNSETGIIQPVKEIAEKVSLKGGYTLCDGVQAAGRMPLDMSNLGVDFMILSAHKMGGPQGAGALIIAHGALTLEAAIPGGGQEKNRRAGTENVAAIAGFGAVIKSAHQEACDVDKIIVLRDSIEQQLRTICAQYDLTDHLVVFGENASRVANTVLFSVRGLVAETALIAFDLEGVAVSSGSACSSGKVGVSHVLQAMGVDNETALGAVRVSLGWNSKQEDCQKFATAFEHIAQRLKKKLDDQK